MLTVTRLQRGQRQAMGKSLRACQKIWRENRGSQR